MTLMILVFILFFIFCTALAKWGTYQDILRFGLIFIAIAVIIMTAFYAIPILVIIAIVYLLIRKRK